MKKYSNPLAIIFVIVLIAIISAIALNTPSLNARAILPTTYNIQNISLETSKSLSTEIDLNKSGIIYFGISGAVLCSNDKAIARVFLLDDAGHKYLVYTNEVNTKNSLATITGLAVAKNSTLVSGCSQSANDDSSSFGRLSTGLAKITGFAATSTQSFRNECGQACYLDSSKFKSNKYKVQVEISSGAVLKISKIIYK